MEEQNTILFIDDEADFREMTASVLKVRGFNVVTAGNGLEGLDKLGKATPDLIILDLNMPKMGGIEFYNRICDDVTNKPICPILVLTARSNVEDLFKQLHIDGFITKPFDMAHLLRDIQLILEKWKRRSESGPKGERIRKISKKVFLVDDHKTDAHQVAIAFLDAGYSVSFSDSGSDAIEQIAIDLPDIVLARLGISDLAGDILALRLKNMSLTKDIHCILYSGLGEAETDVVVGKIENKSGVDDFIHYSLPGELVQEVDKFIEELESEEE